jgi:hypothetical protein
VVLDLVGLLRCFRYRGCSLHERMALCRFSLFLLINVSCEAAGVWREVPWKQLGGRLCWPKYANP